MNVDIAIAGNGVLGLSLATELARRDPRLTIAVVGPIAMPAAASSAAGAMLNCFGEVTKYTFASAPGRARFDVLRAAAAAWPSWLEHLIEAAGDTYGLALHEGTTVIQNARGGQLDTENFAAFLRALEDLGEPHEEVDGADVPGMDPIPDARPLRAVHLPREGWLDSSALLSGLRAACERQGVQLVDAEVAALIQIDGRITGFQTGDGGSVAAATTVLATGARTTQILDTIDDGALVQPVLSGCGVAVELDRVTGLPFTGVVRSVNRAGSCGLHVLPVADGEYVGATNVLFRQPEPRMWPGVCHFLLQCAMEQLDQSMAIARVRSWRIGNRPVSIDTFPLVGRTGLDGLYLLTGTYRDGLHSSPVLAAAVATDLIDGTPALDGKFRPDRAPISTMSVAESVDEFVLQNVSSGFESSMTIPRFWNHRDLGRMFRPLAEEVYEQLDISWGLSPDIVGFLALTRKSAADVTDIAARLRKCTTLAASGSGGAEETDR